MQNNEKHVVIIDETTLNNLKVVSYSEKIIKYQNNADIFNGTEEKCLEFSSHFDEHFFYPIVDQEELY